MTEAGVNSTASLRRLVPRIFSKAQPSGAVDTLMRTVRMHHPKADLGLIEGHLAKVAGGFEPFRVHLRGTGTFRPVSPVVFVTLVEGISRCEQLAAAVRQGPLEVGLTFPYHPHVTIAHHLDDQTLDRAFAELAEFECRFSVGEFSLYVHDSDTGWRATDHFALG